MRRMRWPGRGRTGIYCAERSAMSSALSEIEGMSVWFSVVLIKVQLYGLSGAPRPSGTVCAAGDGGLQEVYQKKLGFR